MTTAPPPSRPIDAETDEDGAAARARSSRRALVLLAALVVAAIVIAGGVLLFFSRDAGHRFVAEEPPTLIRVIDPGPGIGDATLVPLNDRDPVGHRDGTDFLRFVGAEAEFIAAVGEAGVGWLRPIPVGSGECGLSGEVLACATPDGDGLAVQLADGADAPTGDYELERDPEPDAPATVEGLVAEPEAVRLVDGDEVRWELPLPDRAADLNGIGDAEPRFTSDGRILLIALPDGIVAIDLVTGEERWRIAVPVDGWVVDGDLLHVHHDGVVEVFDLTRPQPGEATPVPTDSVPAPAADAALAELEGRTFAFSSGAGAWSTMVEFDGEGGFTAVFHDSDAMSATRAEFHGRFEAVEQVDEHTHRLELVELVVDSPTGTSETSPEGQRIDFVDMPYGFERGTEFLLLAPGAPGTQFSDEHRAWLLAFGADPGDGPLERMVLVNVATEYVLVDIDAEPAPESTPPPTADAAPGAASLDGTWCATPESNPAYGGCFVIEGDLVTADDGRQVRLEAHPVDDGSGCASLTGTDLGASGPGDSGPIGTHCPAGLPIELPDYYTGVDLPDVDRIWNAQTGAMHVRQ